MRASPALLLMLVAGCATIDFEGLPAGEYYVTTSVFWPSGPAPLPFQTDVTQSVLGKRVKVGVGERVEVLLETKRTTERIWKRR